MDKKIVPLGVVVDYPSSYSPELLFSIPRIDNRRALNLPLDSLPFNGADVWNAYELSWLNKKGKPQVAKGRFVFACESPAIIESKSLKLYLNSLCQESFRDLSAIYKVIEHDLSKASGAPVLVELQLLSVESELLEAPSGICLDDLDIEVSQYLRGDNLLFFDDIGSSSTEMVDEVLFSNIFRSNCPVTNQPDWATVRISYHGKKISHQSLLKYLISYRLHSDFHENCVESIFMDIQNYCQPSALTVEANFLRRGGLDINPIRTTCTNIDYQHFPRFERQ